ncbi:hypothetical protein HanXRQr2_Chr11g0518941 [Helianthus annuus]|uniref:Uncharacterized protein n=1 Tax=Helianthus annuus TaxID=4232 RepID=A0A9K3N2A0_HELAN|nr:hypothetical protein HanXRQr2_Chr11g0518941 [Helianthus annuus]KAJ0877439.1 hypothetical protein HanPSC8_Chr11g0500161 [Helianthus annuus]
MLVLDDISHQVDGPVEQGGFHWRNSTSRFSFCLSLLDVRAIPLLSLALHIPS